MTRDAHIVDSAIAWHLRQETMADADWTAFVDWLEADPAHAHAYDAIAAQDRLIGAARIPDAPVLPVAANDDAPAGRRWWPVAGGGAIAAALALWLVPIATRPTGSAQVFATRDGERRDVRLPDGTQVAMNGGTVLRVDGGGARSVELERGEVTLHVVHDPANPFTLRAGGQLIRDVGTTFDVVRTDAALSVAVGEGSVVFQPEGAAVSLTPGDSLRMNIRSGRIERGSVAPDAVGGWRDGRLDFNAAPIGEVVDSLRRRYGMSIALSNRLSRRPFTGMIHVTGIADRDVPHLADLIGATWRRDGEKWILAERVDTTP